ncbi:hypothetical protein EKO27_g10736 [Xylaria grammica]|uniref:DUF1996 domain-containing protein n=1 Tax=Xylaria grammica TaxID=363999 RepID=A0A439CQC4_9PEZI|nr:hypothetical protein EKO27_g10736 [Xylaria grammica]
MQWKALALALLVERGAGQAMPMLRFQCSQLVVDRLDPLVNPGVVPSPHLHQIVGGNSFNASMDPKTHDLPSSSTCTSCTFSEDFSNYWTAVLYFRARNGTYKRVPQFVSEGLRADGGITVYYIPSPTEKEKVTAFKPGFRMLVGDATARAPSAARKVCHRCMPATGDNSNINCGAPDSQFLPKHDVPRRHPVDHMSHVAYPNSSYNDVMVGAYGTCPKSHPVKIPQVMYEVMWNTQMFNDKALWPEDGSQPFVWSTDDKSGYSQHGDYVFGWKDDSLQRAMDARCNGAVCGELEIQSSESAMKCTKSRTVQEDIDGWLTEIPGMDMRK